MHQATYKSICGSGSDFCKSSDVLNDTDDIFSTSLTRYKKIINDYRTSNTILVKSRKLIKADEIVSDLR